mgnify:CR=1 FL=1
MVTLKTQQNDTILQQFIDGMDSPGRKRDCISMRKMMQTITGKPGKMCGSSIVGFSLYDYSYASKYEKSFRHALPKSIALSHLIAREIYLS